MIASHYDGHTSFCLQILKQNKQTKKEEENKNTSPFLSSIKIGLSGFFLRMVIFEKGTPVYASTVSTVSTVSTLALSLSIYIDTHKYFLKGVHVR
jgi:hypothetical protein